MANRNLIEVVPTVSNGLRIDSFMLVEWVKPFEQSLWVDMDDVPYLIEKLAKAYAEKLEDR